MEPRTRDLPLLRLHPRLLEKRKVERCKRTSSERSVGPSLPSKETGARRLTPLFALRGNERVSYPILSEYMHLSLFRCATEYSKLTFRGVMTSTRKVTFLHGFMYSIRIRAHLSPFPEGARRERRVGSRRFLRKTGMIPRFSPRMFVFISRVSFLAVISDLRKGEGSSSD